MKTVIDEEESCEPSKGRKNVWAVAEANYGAY